MALVLLFLYVPIFVLIVFSFNETKSRSGFQRLYTGLVRTPLSQQDNHFFARKHHYHSRCREYRFNGSGNFCGYRHQRHEESTQGGGHERDQYAYHQPRDRYGCIAHATVRILRRKNEPRIRLCYAGHRAYHL